MSGGGPWSVKGIDPKARMAAKEAAQRRGMTLGEWLSEKMLDAGDGGGDTPTGQGENPYMQSRQPYPNPPQSASGPYGEPPYGETRGQDYNHRQPGYPGVLPGPGQDPRRQDYSLTAEIDAITRRLEATEQRSTLAITGIDQSVLGLLARLEGVERSQKNVEVQLANSLKAFEGRLDELDESSDDMATNLSRSMREMGLRLDTQGERNETVNSATRHELGKEVELVNNRSDELSQRLADAERHTDNAIRALEGSFASLETRLRTAEGSLSENSNKGLSELFEKRFQHISNELVKVVAETRGQLAAQIQAEAGNPRIKEMDSALSQMRERLANTESRHAETLERIAVEVSRLGHAVEARLNATDERVDEKFDRVGEKFNALRIEQAAALERVGQSMSDVVERLEARFDTMAAASKESDALENRLRDSEARTADMVEAAMQRLHQRLDETANQAGAQLSPVQQALSDLSDRLQAIEDQSTPPFAAYETASPTPEAVQAPTPFGAFEPPDTSDAGESVPVDAPDISHGTMPEPVQRASWESVSVEPVLDSALEIFPEPDADMAPLAPAAEFIPEAPMLEPQVDEEVAPQDPFVSGAEPVDPPLAELSDPFAFQPDSMSGATDPEPADAFGNDGEFDTGMNFDAGMNFDGGVLPPPADAPVYGETDPVAIESAEFSMPEPEEGLPDLSGNYGTPAGNAEHDPALAVSGLEEQQPTQVIGATADASFMEAARRSMQGHPMHVQNKSNAGFAYPAGPAAPGAAPVREAVQPGGNRRVLMMASVVAVIAVLAAAGVAAWEYFDGSPRTGQIETVQNEDNSGGAPDMSDPYLDGSQNQPVETASAGTQGNMSETGAEATDTTPMSSDDQPVRTAANEPSAGASSTSGEDAANAMPTAEVAKPPQYQPPTQSDTTPDSTTHSDSNTHGQTAMAEPVKPQTRQPRASDAAYKPPSRMPVQTASLPATQKPQIIDGAPTNLDTTSNTRPTLQQAAEAGDPVALYQYAQVLMGAGRVQDGFTTMKRAADRGLPAAQYQLAKYYENGTGTQKDPREARRWTERAANGGNRRAMHNLAMYYAEGRTVPLNYETAAKWFEQAALLGLTNSEFNLALLYEQGLGVPKSTADAYAWYTIAANAGDAGAAKKAQEMEPNLTPEEKTEALSVIANFKPRPLDLAANGVFHNLNWARTAPEGPQAISRAQILLSRLGYDPGPADGNMGEKTKQAVIAYERDNGLAQTGKVDGTLLAKLEKSAVN